MLILLILNEYSEEIDVNRLIFGLKHFGFGRRKFCWAQIRVLVRWNYFCPVRAGLRIDFKPAAGQVVSEPCRLDAWTDSRSFFN